MKTPLQFYLFIFFVTSLSSCKKAFINPAANFSILSEKVQLNPSGNTPLAALISVETSLKTTVSIRVVGKKGSASDVTASFTDLATKHSVPVLGLYGGYSNTVEMFFKDADDNPMGTKVFTIVTDSITANFPKIDINVSTPALMAEGMTFVSYFGYNTTPFPQSPFVFDVYGDIRWYTNFTSSPDLKNLFYDDGMEQLKNGNLYFGDGSSGKIYEMDWLGNIINTWALPGFTFHHNVQEKPNGNFLVTVSKEGSPTIEDYIIEIDRNSKQIITTWNLNESLQYGRQTLFADTVDWVHVNAVVYDESDNTIIVSGRTQGVVKLDNSNKVQWILGCHKGWGKAGNGADLNSFLLQPLDKNKQAITSRDVLDGNTNHPDFEWNWYQHAPLVMPNGHIMLFDNGGDNRNFSGSGHYSRAVEYAIDKTAKTVQQIWSYGKERGAATFAHIVSDVDFLSKSNHVIFSPGGVANGTQYGKVVELDYATQQVLFEATITPPIAIAGIVFHRTERLKFYP